MSDIWWIPFILFGFFVAHYLVISGGLYFLLWKVFSRQLEHRRIQIGELMPGQVKREIRDSLLSFVAMALVCWPLSYLYQTGHTKIYWNFSDYPWWWNLVSLYLAFFWHDVWFYWSHRFLHQPWFFRNVHYVHHLSKIPTPWASHNFHWFEAILQIIFVYPIVMFLPMQGWVFLGFMAITHLFAVWGHFNYELMPFAAWDAWWGRWVTTSTHHNFHHKYHNHNFALYLRGWDRHLKTMNEKTNERFVEYRKEK